MGEIDPYWRNRIIMLENQVNTLMKFWAKSGSSVEDTQWVDLWTQTWNFEYNGSLWHQQKVTLSGAANITVDIDCPDWFYDFQVTQAGTSALLFTASGMNGWRIFNGSFLDGDTYAAWVHNFVMSVEGGYANISYTWPAI